MKIIYPRTINDLTIPTIGVTAPSNGVGRESIWHKRLNEVMHDFHLNGYQLKMGSCLIDTNKHVSSSATKRAQEFMDMWKDPSINLIYPPWGGEMLIDILPHIDFSQLRNMPTWVQGFSDISTLLLSITVTTGIATAHGTNLMDSINGQDKLTRESRDYLKLSHGNIWIQNSSDQWQSEWPKYTNNIRATYNLTNKTYWRTYNRNNSISIKGRLIGGCLDTISRLVGTPYGDVEKFSEVYCKNDGMIFYVENCECKPTEVFKSLFQMKLASWFNNIKGIVIGRNSVTSYDGIYDFDEAILDALADLDVPIILDADIGHLVPQMTLINGSMAQLTVNNGKAVLIQELI